MVLMLLRLVFIPVVFSLFYTNVSVADNGRGKQLFSLCQSCHGMHGEGRKDIEAPSIAGMQDWYVLNQLKGFRNDARGYHALDDAGIRMRPMAKTLRESDLETVAKYVAAMPVKPSKSTFKGNILTGKKLYGTCGACHGANGKGMKAVNAPALSGLDDWYMMKQIKNYQQKIRGGDVTKDPYGIAMVGPAQLLKDDQAIKDVITYIRALR